MDISRLDANNRPVPSSVGMQRHSSTVACLAVTNRPPTIGRRRYPAIYLVLADTKTV